MAKQKKDDIQQVLLDQIAQLNEKISKLEQKQQPIAPKRERGAPRPEVYYVLLGIPSQGLPPQAIACARILATAVDTNHIPESEAMELMDAGKRAGKLKSVQGSWHIFQYYRAKLIAGDYLLMITVGSDADQRRSQVKTA